MADRTDYTKLLGERLERAYRAKDDIKPPSAEDIARWKRLAQAKRKEKRKRMKLIASLASVFAVAFCISIVPMFKIPDAQAGEDYFVDIQDFRENDENMIVETYTTYDNLPEDVREEFYIFEKLPEGYELSEMRVVTFGEKKKCETEIKNKNNSNYFIIMQRFSEGSTEAVVNSDFVENWYGIDVYGKKYTNGDNTTNYEFAIDSSFIDIVADSEVDKEIIKQTIKEAVF